MEYSQVVEAMRALSGVIHRTPLQMSKTFSRLSGSDAFFKLENLQKTGAFKIRGAFNRVAHMGVEEKKSGVIAASAGNHAQGVALAAAHFGISSTVVMPVHAPQTKVEATTGYGSKVVLYGENYDEAYRHAVGLAATSGATFVHAFDDPYVIAGQGTIGMELMQEQMGLDAILVPVGGGGLISGIAAAVKSINSRVKVIGVQPTGAPSMVRSLRAGKRLKYSPLTQVADGLAVKLPGELTFSMVQRWVDDMVEVTDEEITQAMWLLLERNKLLVEGAGAAGVAALLKRDPRLVGKKVAVVVSGGNVDLSRLLSLQNKAVMV